MSEVAATPRIRSGLFELATQDVAPPRRLTLWAVVALFALLLIWALLARIDIVSVAPGRLVPETYVKIVQPSDAGIIREILVKDGDSVEKDQVLIRLDPTESTADSTANSRQLALERLQVRRLESELSGKMLARQPGDDPILFERVNAQRRDHAQSVSDAVDQAVAASARVSKELMAARQELLKLEKTAPMLRSAAESYRQLAGQNLVGRLEAEERERLATEREQDFAGQRATVESLQSSLLEAGRAVEQIRSRSRSDLQMELSATAARVSQLEQADVKLGFRSRNLELRAPQAGVVKDLATTTVGAVVQPGTVLLNLVPVNELLRAEVSISNEDIGFVRTGQTVRLKLATFPFQRYGMIEGIVQSVSPDSATTRSEQAVDKKNEPTMPGYKGIIQLGSQSLSGGMGEFALGAGMELTAEIVEGKRTVMQYLLSPVQRVRSEAGRER